MSTFKIHKQTSQIKTYAQKSDLNKSLSFICSGLICIYLLLALSLFSNKSSAEQPTSIKTQSLALKVLSNKGIALSSVVVELQGSDSLSQALSKSANDKSALDKSGMAIMDQVDQQFVPHVLVVQQGQAVSFPNSDEVKHHVYSFSPTKTFQQQLYKGKEAKPIQFANPGIVELGCNIHDWMQGFIYVANSHQYSLSDEQGIVTIKTDSIVEQVHIWHPLMQEQTKRMTFKLSDLKQIDGVYQIALTEALNESLTDYERFSIDVY